MSNIDIPSILTEDANNVYVKFNFYGIPTDINYITPSNVIMMNYNGTPNNPNVTLTNKNILNPTNASKYIASTAYISSSDFQYQNKDTTIDSKSLQFTIKCTSLDSASIIYCIFFINNDIANKKTANAKNQSQALNDIIESALENTNNIAKTDLELKPLLPKNPDIAYFSQQDPALGKIDYYLILSPIGATFDIKKFGSLTQIHSQLLNLYKPPSTIYLLNKSVMQTSNPAGTLTYSKVEGFSGYREGFGESFSNTTQSPSSDLVDTTLNYNEDLIGVDENGNSRVDPNGGTVMYYGEDMICQESGIDSQMIHSLPAIGSKDLMMNYIVIGIAAIIAICLFVYGIPYIIHSFISNCFSKSKNSFESVLVFMVIIIFKNIFGIYAFMTSASGKRGAKGGCEGIDTDDVLGMYRFLGGVGGYFKDYYVAKGENGYCEISNVLDNTINIDIPSQGLTYSQIKEQQTGSTSIQIKNIISTLTNQIRSLSLFLFVTFFFIAFGLFYDAFNPKTMDKDFYVNINKPTALGGIFVSFLYIIISMSIMSLFSSIRPNRVYVGNNLDVLFNYAYGYLLVPKGYTPLDD